MSHDDLLPYAFARGRFAHACVELDKEATGLHERLINAIIALAPLRAEDMPRSCQRLYERLQRLIGEEVWRDRGNGGSLDLAIRQLSLSRAARVGRWIVMASDTLDKHCGVQDAQPGKRPRAR